MVPHGGAVQWVGKQALIPCSCRCEAAAQLNGVGASCDTNCGLCKAVATASFTLEPLQGLGGGPILTRC